MSTGMPLKKIVSLILIIVVIATILLYSPKIYTMVKPILEMGEDQQTTQQKQSNTISIFNKFIQEYKECKSTEDLACSCGMTSFNLPEGYFIEIKNKGGETLFNLYKGHITSPEDAEEGVLILGHDHTKTENKEEYKIKERDFPYIYQGLASEKLLGTAYINTNSLEKFIGRFSVFISENKVITSDGEYPLLDLFKPTNFKEIENQKQQILNQIKEEQTKLKNQGKGEEHYRNIIEIEVAASEAGYPLSDQYYEASEKIETLDALYAKLKKLPKKAFNQDALLFVPSFGSVDVYKSIRNCITLTTEEKTKVNKVFEAFSNQEDCLSTNTEEQYCGLIVAVEIPKSIEIEIDRKEVLATKENKKVTSSQVSYSLCRLDSNEPLTQKDKAIRFYALEQKICFEVVSDKELKEIETQKIINKAKKVWS